MRALGSEYLRSCFFCKRGIMQLFSADVKCFQKDFKILFLTPKKWKNWPQKLLIIGQTLSFHSPAQTKSPQPKIDSSYYEISGPDILSVCFSEPFAFTSYFKKEKHWADISKKRPRDLSKRTCTLLRTGILRIKSNLAFFLPVQGPPSLSVCHNFPNFTQLRQLL